ncbi:hypothetical protein K505DRAFT_405425 [Melanomma pulvis-pyrius CBS 109.77]|uniref:Uncharacterized protein n=1 Tax=Melanomma pulvis-pyrius CBS 109.77 TaxID=1314802 RepID=A0A6A6XPE1_9PLEO|nr:hypothetical protein K505DRAFT_405425 [Melanomma pulvis-pyrius CBS 109.77]
MPPLPGFSDNPFRTRSDLIRAALAILHPLEAYKSPAGARIKIATATGAGFSETAAQLEGFARPLWVVADLIRIQSLDAVTDPGLRSTNVRLTSWIAGLKVGTDPESLEYWGNAFDFDQRLVEMESIAYALLTWPDAFSFTNDPKARENLIKWLRKINHCKVPQNNWLWFRVFVNLALTQVLDVPLVEVREHIDSSLRILDSFYIGAGWSSDGLWSEERKQVDYYSGSFAIQFAQLLFVRFAPEYDQERTQRYTKEAAEFASGFWRYFSSNGAAIPFGRSLTYRFAFAAFWTAVAVADVKLPIPLNHPGAIKGMLLRHLRWWSKKPDIFNTDGTPNIGYAYSNMHMAEDYNSPQSVFWCLKSFLVIGLSKSHPFWSSEELPYPMETTSSSLRHIIPDVSLVSPPRHILCNTPEHHFLLSSGQSTRKRFKAREAKYGKFAYSSTFAFSVPCGTFLEQLAPDSTLAVSYGDDQAWKVRWEPFDVVSTTTKLGDETVPTLASSWKPWLDLELVIRTILVPPVSKWPGWHLRAHRVSWKPSFIRDTAPTLRLVDAGFAASAQTSQGHSILEEQINGDFRTTDGANQQNWWSGHEGCLVISESGASGVVDLTDQFVTGQYIGLNSQSMIIRADPNTNLIAPRSLIPSAQHELLSSGEAVFWLVTGVFAVDSGARKSMTDVWNLWHGRPTGCINNEGNIGLALHVE